MPELIFPFAGSFPVTQPFANVNDREPAGYLAPDGSINYDSNGTPGHWHNGIDYGLPCGTPLVAACDGSVVAAGQSPSGFGLRVMIQDPAGRVVLTGHMQRIGVSQGQQVKQGQSIGDSGSTGNSTGCHVHVSVLRAGDGSYIDPKPFLTPVPPPPRPPDLSRITFVSFTVSTALYGGTRVWDGPSEQLRELAGLNPGDELSCDAWMMGAPKWDNNAKAWDRRWYHRKAGGWVASARVIGNAPNSTP